MITSYIVIKLGLRFPNQTFVDYSQLIVGKFFGKIITLIYILFFIHITATIMREFGEVINTVFLIRNNYINHYFTDCKSP